MSTSKNTNKKIVSQADRDQKLKEQELLLSQYQEAIQDQGRHRKTSVSTVLESLDKIISTDIKLTEREKTRELMSSYVSKSFKNTSSKDKHGKIFTRSKSAGAGQLLPTGSDPNSVFSLAEKLVQQNLTVEEIMNKLDDIIKADIAPEMHKKTRQDVEKMVRIIKLDCEKNTAVDSQQLRKCSVKTSSNTGTIQHRNSEKKKSTRTDGVMLDVRCSVIIDSSQLRNTFVEKLKHSLTVLSLINHRNILNVDSYSIINSRIEVHFDVKVGQYISINKLLHLQKIESEKSGNTCGLNASQIACIFVGVCKGLCFLTLNKSLKDYLPGLDFVDCLTLDKILLTSNGVVKLSGFEEIAEVTDMEEPPSSDHLDCALNYAATTVGNSVYYDDTLEFNSFSSLFEQQGTDIVRKDMNRKTIVEETNSCHLRLAELIAKLDDPLTNDKRSSHKRKILDDNYYGIYSILTDWDSVTPLDFRPLLFSQFVKIVLYKIDSMELVLSELYEKLLYDFNNN